MKITQYDDVNLLEFLEFVLENNISGVFESVTRDDVSIEIKNGNIDTKYGKQPVNNQDAFRINKEIEINEYTKIPKLVACYLSYDFKIPEVYSECYDYYSIDAVLKLNDEEFRRDDSCYKEFLIFYQLNPDGIMIPIWKDGSMLD